MIQYLRLTVFQLMIFIFVIWIVLRLFGYHCFTTLLCTIHLTCWAFKFFIRPMEFRPSYFYTILAVDSSYAAWFRRASIGLPISSGSIVLSLVALLTVSVRVFSSISSVTEAQMYRQNGFVGVTGAWARLQSYTSLANKFDLQRINGDTRVVYTRDLTLLISNLRVWNGFFVKVSSRMKFFQLPPQFGGQSSDGMRTVSSCRQIPSIVGDYSGIGVCVKPSIVGGHSSVGVIVQGRSRHLLD